MATLVKRLADFTTEGEPQAGVQVELLCEDHNGTYVIPFACHYAEGIWRNSKTGEDLQARVMGWRAW